MRPLVLLHSEVMTVKQSGLEENIRFLKSL